jgi:hypothetical protein
MNPKGAIIYPTPQYTKLGILAKDSFGIIPPKFYYGSRDFRCGFASSNFYISKHNWSIEFLVVKKYYLT